MQRHRVRGKLSPRGGHREVVLLQHGRLVHEAHRPDVLGHGIDSAADGHLAPRPGREVALVLRHVLGDVHEVFGPYELRQVVELDLGHVRTGTSGHRRGELGVESATRTIAGGHFDGDVRISLFEVGYNFLRVGRPGPPREGDLRGRRRCGGSTG